MGSISGMPYQQETLAFESGDLLLLYTDGVSEAMGENEEEFGEERIQETVKKYRTESPEAILGKLGKGVVEFHRSDSFADDFTLVLCRVL